LNPDPHIVEVTLDARMGGWTFAPGMTVHAMTYNGSVPGPILEAGVGDTVIVHFTNHLTEATSVHWHGVRVPNAMDGAPMVQTPVPPGGAFDCRFVLLAGSEVAALGP
jgi:FtsP/CotA-like multicopper oxidase with cupredoxin domain